MTNCVLTVAYNLEYSAIEPFLCSLRRTSKHTRVHVFICGVSKKTERLLHKAGCTTERFRFFSYRMNQPMARFAWPLCRTILGAITNARFRRKVARWCFDLFGVRWLLYEKFLQAEKSNFDRVLLTDCRDVLFQADPFESLLPPGVHAFLEAKSQRIGTCIFNKAMIEDCFGQDELLALADKRVTCAGTVYGDPVSLLHYSALMIDILCRVKRVNTDQGVHNYIIYRGLLPDFTLHENGDSIIFTMGAEKPEHFRQNEKGLLVQKDGCPIPVLHQYDRFPSLARDLRRIIC